MENQLSKLLFMGTPAYRSAAPRLFARWPSPPAVSSSLASSDLHKPGMTPQYSDPNCLFFISYPLRPSIDMHGHARVTLNASPPASVGHYARNGELITDILSVRWLDIRGKNISPDSVVFLPSSWFSCRHLVGNQPSLGPARVHRAPSSESTFAQRKGHCLFKLGYFLAGSSISIVDSSAAGTRRGGLALGSSTKSGLTEYTICLF